MLLEAKDGEGKLGITPVYKRPCAQSTKGAHAPPHLFGSGGDSRFGSAGDALRLGAVGVVVLMATAPLADAAARFDASAAALAASASVAVVVTVGAFGDDTFGDARGDDLVLGGRGGELTPEYPSP